MKIMFERYESRFVPLELGINGEFVWVDVNFVDHMAPAAPPSCCAF